MSWVDDDVVSEVKKPDAMWSDDDVVELPSKPKSPSFADKVNLAASRINQTLLQPVRDLGNLAVEVPTALVTGMGGALAGNIMGAGSDIYSAIAGQPKVGEQVRQNVINDLTYQPRARVAQEALQLISKGLQESKLEGLPVVGQELPAVVRAARQGVPAASELMVAKMSAPSEKMIRFAKQNQPKIEAAKEAQRLGLVVDPSEVNPTLKNRVYAGWARPEIIDVKGAKLNLPKIQAILRQEAGVEGDVLNGETLKAARDVISKPYDDVRTIGQLAPNVELANRLRASIPRPITGKENQVKPAVKSLEKIAEKLEKGELNASDVVDDIRGYRGESDNWYKIAERGDAKRNPTEMAKVYKTIANTLEDAIEANLPKDSDILSNFRNARQNLAKNYTVEKIINTESGIPNLALLNSGKLSSAPLSGDLAALRNIQANFPEVARSIDKYGAMLPNTVSRSTFGGTAGSGAALATGTSPAAGGIYGAASGLIGGRFIANKMLSPEYQSLNVIPKVPGPKRNPRTVILNQDVPQSGLSLSFPATIAAVESDAPSVRGLIGLADDYSPAHPSLGMPVVDIPLDPQLRPMYGNMRMSQPERMMLEPQLSMPVINFEKGSTVLPARGLMSLADESQPMPDTLRMATRHDVPTVDFPLRQEVLQHPSIVESTQQFIAESEHLKSLIANSSGFWRKGYQNQLMNLENEFAAGMRQIGVDSPQDAVGGLNRLYGQGNPTKLPIEHGYVGGLNQLLKD